MKYRHTYNRYFISGDTSSVFNDYVDRVKLAQKEEVTVLDYLESYGYVLPGKFYMKKFNGVKLRGMTEYHRNKTIVLQAVFLRVGCAFLLVELLVTLLDILNSLWRQETTFSFQRCFVFPFDLISCAFLPSPNHPLLASPLPGPDFCSPKTYQVEDRNTFCNFQFNVRK